MLNPDSILSKLIMAMVTAYWNGHYRDPDMAWVPHTELAKITVAYSQRFGEWYAKSNKHIKVEKRSDGDNNYSYRLTTCPDNIDWDKLRLKMTGEPIKHAGRVVERRRCRRVWRYDR